MNCRIVAIIVAAGSSSRLPGDLPKVYRELNGKMVLEYSLDVFKSHSKIDQLLVVANPEHEPHYRALKEREQLWVVGGGKTRQESVYHGLDALADNPPDWVLVHDAARPNVSAVLIDRVLEALTHAPAAVPCLPVTDTIKREVNGMASETLPRETLRAVQTPQAFHYTELLAAHLAAREQSYTDDAAVMEAVGVPVLLMQGDAANVKLTTLADWQKLSAAQLRVGMGYDVHRLVEDEVRPLMLCGVEVASALALEGHSDADVGLHALVDALLGAIGQGDIGEHFPPSDVRWKDADSSDFVFEAMRLLKQRGGRVVNADITFITQTPKLAEHKVAMRGRVAELLEVAVSQVNIKATTTEGLGFTGRKEGIAAQAIVNVQC